VQCFSAAAGCPWGRKLYTLLLYEEICILAAFSASRVAASPPAPVFFFELLQILPRQNEKDPTRVDVEVMVREKPMQTADIEAEWGIAPGQQAPCLLPCAVLLGHAPGGFALNHALPAGHMLLPAPLLIITHKRTNQCPCPAPALPPALSPAADNGKPGLVSLVPGGTITYENRNLFGNAASVAASVNTKNFLQPADDLSFRVQYSQVRRLGWWDGVVQTTCARHPHVLFACVIVAGSSAATSSAQRALACSFF
jgi:hypothetical protein